MLRTILLQKTYQNIILNKKFKNILQTDVRFGVLHHVTKSTTLYNSCWVVPGYFYNFNKKHDFLKESISFHNDERLMHTNTVNCIEANQIKISAFDLRKASQEFFKINMSDLKQAPLAAFWVGIAGLAPFILPPLSSIIIGYSPVLSAAELAYGTAVLACLGGAKWGYLVANNQFGTWENYTLCGIPLLIATVAIVSPMSLRFLLVIAGLLISFIIDLTTGHYPPWYLSLRGVLTNVSVFFLLIALLQRLIH